MKNRKTYSIDDAIALVRDQNYAVAEADRNSGVSAQVLGRWIRETENDDGHAFRGNGNLRRSKMRTVNLKLK